MVCPQVLLVYVHRCRLQDEDGDNYGPMIVPENTVADAIQKRTNEHLNKLGGVTVSSKPIIMRVEWVNTYLKIFYYQSIHSSPTGILKVADLKLARHWRHHNL